MATALADLELPVFDYLDPSLRGERFHEAMADLGQQGWLATMPLGCVAIDREAGEFFLRSRSFTFPGMKIAEIFGIDEGPLFEEIRRNILHLNGPDHRRLRGLVNPAFTPRAVEKWRPAMRALLQELFDDLQGATAADAVEAFAKPYPSKVIATVMGAPLEDAERLWDWSRWIQRQFGMKVLEEREQIEHAVVEFYAYAGKLHADRRRAGRRPARRRRAAQPRAQRARGRRGHDPEPARPRAPAVRRAPRPVGAARAQPAARAAGGRGGRPP